MKQFYPILVILFSTLGFRAYAQDCTPPTAATVTPTPANCAGQGSVTISNVSGGSGQSFQYALYDQVNANVVKPFQDSTIIRSIALGNYTVRIRAVCSSGVSAPFAKPVNVAGNATPLSFQSITLNRNDIGCNTGGFTALARGGFVTAESPYRYSLVPTQNAAEPVTNYVRPPQTSRQFSGLASGTYYVRVYDACGTFATGPITVPRVTPPTTNPININTNNLRYYACDSATAYFFINPTASGSVGNQRPPGSPDISWVKYPDGRVDTIRTFNYNSGINFSLRNNNTWPYTVQIGYRTVCGTIVTRDVTFVQPDLALQLTTVGGTECNVTTYNVNALDNANRSYDYYNTSLSLDSGATWVSTVTNTGNHLNVPLNNGTTYNLVLASECDTVRQTVTTVTPVFDFTVNEGTAYACNGKTGLGLSFRNGNNNTYSGIVDSIRFEVLSQPDPANGLPATFQYYQFKQEFWINKNLPIGPYTLRGTDQCGNTQTKTFTLLRPSDLSYTIQQKEPCSVTSGLILTLNHPNYSATPVYGGGGFNSDPAVEVYDSTGARVGTARLLSDRFRYPATIDITNVPFGRLTIKVFKTGAAANTRVCSIDTVYANMALPPLSLAQSLVTSGCVDGGTNSATIASQASGGGGGYQYSLYQVAADGTETLVRAQAPDNIFNGLNADFTYKVRAIDACGNGTDYTTSFSEARVPFVAQPVLGPCVGDTFNLAVSDVDNAVYSWRRNGEPIPGEISPTLSQVVDGSIQGDTFNVAIQLEECLVFSKTYGIDTSSCGKPLPVNLVSFDGQKEGYQTNLTWRVTEEFNVSHYVVEMAPDAKNFTKVTTVKASETKAATKTYTAKDYTAIGDAYYRLRVVDFDGSLQFSKIIFVAGETTASKDRLFPNPAAASLNLEIDFSQPKAKPAKIWITDVAGRKVGGTLSRHLTSGKNIIKVSINELPEGVYLINYQTDGDKAMHKRFVKSH